MKKLSKKEMLERRKARQAYTAAKYRQINIKLDREADADLISYLDTVNAADFMRTAYRNRMLADRKAARRAERNAGAD